jgi:hypothetical protein
MLCPRAIAQPAELVPALAAGHMHAPLVLLNGPVALGAGLGVGQDPVEVLTLRAVLGDPLAHSVARHLRIDAAVQPWRLVETSVQRYIASASSALPNAILANGTDADIGNASQLKQRLLVCLSRAYSQLLLYCCKANGTAGLQQEGTQPMLTEAPFPGALCAQHCC